MSPSSTRVVGLRVALLAMTALLPQRLVAQGCFVETECPTQHFTGSVIPGDGSTPPPIVAPPALCPTVDVCVNQICGNGRTDWTTSRAKGPLPTPGTTVNVFVRGRHDYYYPSGLSA